MMNRLEKMIRSEAFIQLICWTIYFVMAIFGRGTYWNSISTTNLALIVLAFPISFVVNATLMIPQLFKKKKWLLYFATMLLTIAGIELLRILLGNFSEINNNTNPADRSIETFLGPQNTFTSSLLGFIVSFAYFSVKDWIRSIRIIEKLKSEKLSTELAFLRSQVDPHFLFNTLNGLYGLALEEKGYKTADGIAQLGGLMRYNLHDSQKDFIRLKNEIEFIEKYIALQKLRIQDNNAVSVRIQISKAEAERCSIAPMLLVTFIENAFKYGISPTEKTNIHIELSVENRILILTTRNSIIKNAQSIAGSAVGLTNAISRLDILYPGKYTFHRKEVAGVFFVKLQLNLDT